MRPVNWLSHLLATTSTSRSTSSSAGPDAASVMTVASLHRYAVKGLSGDRLERVQFQAAGETFPDDRRYALLLDTSRQDFQEGDWLHKENFLCAFSDPEFLAQFHSSYRIIQAAAGKEVELGNTQRLLTIKHRLTGQVLLEDIDLQEDTNRRLFSDFMSRESGKKVQCITSSSTTKHTHQFGNTSSGYKQRKDTRTVHIINQSTIDDLSETLQLPSLHATRFRPNIVLHGAPAWAEFDWVGKKQLVEQESGLTLTVISKTVRCKGVSIDPDEYPNAACLDVPRLLTQHYPQYGPYLGVYAVVDVPGSMRIGSEFTLQDI
jgi:uncharacterized protein YcbX